MDDKLQILIIDDDMATVEMIRDKVSWDKLGISNVFTAYNIGSAKAVLIENQIQIIVSDIEMPQGSGLDLLEWFREQNMEGEFLLLTCHERFDYATTAVRLHASEYLLKPFNVEVMEAALKKIVLKVQEEEILKENSEYGKWVKNNQRQLEIAFWNRIFLGYASQDEVGIREEISRQKLPIAANQIYRIIVSRVTNIEKDKVKMNQDLLMFIMENIHSEILCGNPENRTVLCYDYSSFYVLVTVCREQLDYRERARQLIQSFKMVFQADITCCIGNACNIWELYETYRHDLDLIQSNVGFYGASFTQEEAISDSTLQDKSLLNFGILQEMLQQKRKMEFLAYLKKQLGDRLRENLLSDQILMQEKQEILQAVYTYLGKRNMPVSGLLAEDDALNVMTQKASQSVTDMIRWSGYLWDKVFAYEKEVLNADSVIEKVNRYIREHYSEAIGKEEIAAELFLAPDYLSKMYKKKTGRGIKDYIGEYRINEAKILLEKGMHVSDAAERVGFENFTYFSTMFKKYTGVSPNQYRKK